MASNMSPEMRAEFEEMLAKAEPLPEDDPSWDEFEGGCGFDTFDADYFARVCASFAKRALEGRF